MLSVTAATATQAQTPTTKTTTATAATERGRREVRGREGEMKGGRRGVRNELRPVSLRISGSLGINTFFMYSMSFIKCVHSIARLSYLSYVFHKMCAFHRTSYISYIT